jgi:hypothetical protein
MSDHIVTFSVLPLEPEQDGAIRSVAVAGGAERPVELGLDPDGPVEQAAVAQPDDEPPGGVEPKKWRKKVKEAGAFGKHARSDYDLTYEYNHIFMEAYLVCAVAAHSRLTRPTPDCLRFIFWLWFDFQYPHLVEQLPVAFESRDVEQLKKISRTKFLQIFGPQFIGNPPKPDQ